MKFATTLKQGYEIKFQEEVKVVEWQIPQITIIEGVIIAFSPICIAGVSKFVEP